MTKGRPPASRAKMLDAAAFALSENPTASMTEIAARAKVGRATLHRHFASRYELLCELTRRALHDTDEACERWLNGATGAREELECTIAALVPIGDRYHFLAHVMEVMAEPDIAAHYQAQVNQIAALIERAKAEGVVDADVPTAWIAQTLDTLIYASWAAVREGTTRRDEVASLVTRTLLDGLGPRDERRRPPER